MAKTKARQAKTEEVEQNTDVTEESTTEEVKPEEVEQNTEETDETESTDESPQKDTDILDLGIDDLDVKLVITLGDTAKFDGTLYQFLSQHYRSPITLYETLGLLVSSIDAQNLASLEQDKQSSLASLEAIALGGVDVSTVIKSIKTQFDKALKKLQTGSTNAEKLAIFFGFIKKKKTTTKPTGSTSYGWDFARSHVFLADFEIQGLDRKVPHVVLPPSMLTSDYLSEHKIPVDSEIFIAIPVTGEFSKREFSESTYTRKAEKLTEVQDPIHVSMGEKTADKFSSSAFNRAIGTAIYGENSRNVDGWQGLSLLSNWHDLDNLPIAETTSTE